jgi:hypothetical protein
VWSELVDELDSAAGDRRVAPPSLKGVDAAATPAKDEGLSKLARNIPVALLERPDDSSLPDRFSMGFLHESKEEEGGVKSTGMSLLEH